MSMMTRAQFKKWKERREAMEMQPGAQPKTGPKNKKIITPKEFKRLQEAQGDEKRQEDAEAQRLMEEAAILEAQRHLPATSTSLAALALLAKHFNLDLVPRMPDA